MNEMQNKKPNLLRVAAELATYGDRAMIVAHAAMSVLANTSFYTKEGDAA